MVLTLRLTKQSLLAYLLVLPVMLPVRFRLPVLLLQLQAGQTLTVKTGTLSVAKNTSVADATTVNSSGVVGAINVPE